MRENRTEIDITSVEFDDENPRIKGALEKYGDSITAERIHFALQNSSDEGARNSSGFHSLKMSIRANKGIAEPIKVIEKDGRHICIDGNTRLAIYKDFAKDPKNDAWQKIPCVLMEDANETDIAKIRITAHLLGARPWPAYEKARYLYELRYSNLWDYREIIALCGGNKSGIETQINAFDEMNEYYRDKVDDSDFQIDRFSGFVELQKQGIKNAIFQAGLKLSDFGEWIHKGNIHALADVRQLPRVLRDEEAREKFISGGRNSIKKAIKIVDEKTRPSNEETANLEKAGLYDLAYSLTKKLERVTMLEISHLSDDGDTLSTFDTLIELLSEVVSYARK